jgi:hypothetical protein
MVYDKPENYRSYKFNTWYHDDSSMTDKSVTPEFLKDKISFYTFFDQL